MKVLVNSLIICSFLLCACSKEIVESDSMTVNALRKSDLLGQWKLKSFSDGKATEFEVTLEIKDEEGKYTFNGRSSVNFYFASPLIDENKKTISIDVIGSTKMAGTPEANQFEMTFFERLKNIERFEFKDKSTLVFYLSNPEKEALFFERK